MFLCLKNTIVLLSQDTETQCSYFLIHILLTKEASMEVCLMIVLLTFTDPSYRQDDRDGMNLKP